MQYIYELDGSELGYFVAICISTTLIVFNVRVLFIYRVGQKTANDFFVITLPTLNHLSFFGTYTL